MIKISKMSGKLKGFKSINTNPLTNNFCNKMQTTNNICKKCYSRRMLKEFRCNCVPPFQNNSEIFSSSILSEKELPSIKDKYFRLHSHGELINDIHLINFVNIAKKNPNTMFALWTKRKDLINKFKGEFPENLILIYSSLKMNKIEKLPNHFHKVFTVFDKENADSSHINCKQKCSECYICYTKNDITYVNEHLKYRGRSI